MNQFTLQLTKYVIEPLGLFGAKAREVAVPNRKP